MAKRLSASMVDWAAMAERVPPNEKHLFNMFKAKSDLYLRRVLANPAEPPKIDWAFYKSNIPIAGLVDNFQKQYEALKVPYPPDNVTSQVENQWENLKKEVATFKTDSDKRIEAFKAEISKISTQIPTNEMTLDEFYEAHPELNQYQNPSFWPHDEHHRTFVEKPPHLVESDH